MNRGQQNGQMQGQMQGQGQGQRQLQGQNQGQFQGQGQGARGGNMGDAHANMKNLVRCYSSLLLESFFYPPLFYAVVTFAGEILGIFQLGSYYERIICLGLTYFLTLQFSQF